MEHYLDFGDSFCDNYKYDIPEPTNDSEDFEKILALTSQPGYDENFKLLEELTKHCNNYELYADRLKSFKANINKIFDKIRSLEIKNTFTQKYQYGIPRI